MEKMYIKQHKRMAMGEKITGQDLPGMKKSKGKKGDPKHSPAMMSKGKKNA